MAGLILVAGAAWARGQEFQRLERVDTPPKKSGFSAWLDSVGSGVKKVATAAVPATPVKGAPDATSLGSKARPGAELYLAVARSYEEAGRPQESEAQFERLFRAWPNHLEGMLAQAQFLDRQNRMSEAIAVYQRAARVHPKEPAVPNALGLCFAEHNMFPEAVDALQRAVKLAPKQAVFRNNLAMVLVETGRTEEAYAQLREVNDEATTYYNLGYLLQKRGNQAEAAGCFATALKHNPALGEARVWLDHLNAQMAESEGPGPALADRRAAPVSPNPRQSSGADNVVRGVPRPSVPADPRTPAPPTISWPQARPDASGPPELALLPPLPPPMPRSQPPAAPPIVPGGGPPSPAPSVQPMTPPAAGQRGGLNLQEPWTALAPPLPAQVSRPIPSREAQPADVSQAWAPERTASAAPLPPTVQPTGTPAYGTRDTRVVYPLPPVDDAPVRRY
ncbi:MAG: tetratricopeptide repeat protein [Pirellulales bacterium]|nr:tetratricopeptide repeat protein [Pirellulales bacterium]